MAPNSAVCRLADAKHAPASQHGHENRRETQQGARRPGAAAEAEFRAPGDLSGYGLRVGAQIYRLSSRGFRFNFSDLKSDQKEALENFQSRLTKVEHSYAQPQDLGYVAQKEEPNTQYEQLRRRIAANTVEFWYFIRAEVMKIQKQAEAVPEILPSLDYILSLGVEHKR